MKRKKIQRLLLASILHFVLILSQALIAGTFEDKVNYYKTLYGVNCASEKITDNFGNGNDSLYGTRNMRVILHGVAYRGGANNYYHKSEKRENQNPLPEDGLINLAMQNFSLAVYLYGKNFTQSKKMIATHNADTLRYMQNSGNEREQLKKLMFEVIDVINKPEKGPIYFHCWNGWHQSGYVSAAILMQFCNLTNEQAYKYWLDNTDGVNKGYEKVKNMVKTFKRFNDIQIPDSTAKLICPCLK